MALIPGLGRGPLNILLCLFWAGRCCCRRLTLDLDFDFLFLYIFVVLALDLDLLDFSFMSFLKVGPLRLIHLPVLGLRMEFLGAARLRFAMNKINIYYPTN